MKPQVHKISPAPLTYDAIEEILEQRKRLVLSDESVRLIQKSKAFLDRKLAQSEAPIYGINTGFGALCDRKISKADLSKLQENLIVSHACNVGAEVPADVVRLMLLLKAHALAKGNS